MTESTVVNEILEMGQMQMARENLIQFIRGRFPEVLTPDVEHAIADQPSIDLLRHWIGAVARAKNGEEFLAVLRK